MGLTCVQLFSHRLVFVVVFFVLQFVLFFLFLQLLLFPLGQLTLELTALGTRFSGRVPTPAAVALIAKIRPRGGLGRTDHLGDIIDPAKKEPALPVILVPVQLYQERLLLQTETSLAGLMDLVERVLRNLQHLHIGTELLDEGFDDESGGGSRRDPDAFGGNFLTRGCIMRLVIKPHHSMELKLLKHRKKKLVRHLGMKFFGKVMLESKFSKTIHQLV